MSIAIRTQAAAAVAAALDPVFLDVCGHPARVALIRRLVEHGEADISELAAAFPQDRSVISRHLTALQRAGLLTAQRKGRRVIYDLNGPHLLRLLETLTAAIRALSDICCPPTSTGTEAPHEKPDEAPHKSPDD